MNVGRDRVVELVGDDAVVSPGELDARGFQVRWEAESIHLKTPEHELELGPGDGNRLVLQLSRSASWKRPNWMGRLLKRPPRKQLWLNVRMRSPGVPPVYFCAPVPHSVNVVGFPVLPGLAVEVDWAVLKGFLALCLRLDVQISSWHYDDTQEVEVQEDPMAELKALLNAPSMAHWGLLCRRYDALSAEAAGRILPRLKAELANWPDTLRDVEPDNEPIALDVLLRRSHSHVELARVLRLMPHDEDVQKATDLELLSASPQASELSRLTIHKTSAFKRKELWRLLTSKPLTNLTHVSVQGFELNDAWVRKYLKSDNARRLISLRLHSCNLKPSHTTLLRQAAEAGLLPTLTTLDISDNPGLGDAGLRELVQGSAWSGLETLVARHVGLSSPGALELLDTEGLAHLDELRVGWMLVGREMLVVTGRNTPVETLDLYRRSLGRDTKDGGYSVLLAFLKCRRFANVQKISLAFNDIEDKTAMLVAQAHHLRHVREIDLSDNHITNTTLLALAQAPQLAGLQKLDVMHTRLTAPDAPRILGAWKQRNPSFEVVRPRRIPTRRELKELVGFNIDPDSGME